ncbi:MAG: tRNA (adenosine(37)-N6)-dimethylallyltransferase MiaA [Pseudomonadota bacterium]
MSAPRLLLIAGPTAAGKTALAIEAARRLDADIINADSMQVYAGLSVLTARPSLEEVGAVPHHLFGHVDPGERYTTGRWLKDALSVIRDLRAADRRAVLVGGTGLYFKALTEGLAPTPDIPADVKARAQALLDAHGVEGLRAEAERLDPDAAARIAGADRQRLLRVIEVAWATGAPLSALQGATEPAIAAQDWTGLVLEPDRDTLYARIDARYDAMVKAGGLNEARAIAERALDPQLPVMKAVGLPPLLDHLGGVLSLEAAIEQGARDTRRYAKRQFTWFRNQTPDWARITSLDPERSRAELRALIDDQL